MLRLILPLTIFILYRVKFKVKVFEEMYSCLFIYLFSLHVKERERE